MLKKINFIGVCYKDQQRAFDFYTQKLGFEVVTDQPFNDDQRWIELKLPSCETGLVLFNPEGSEDRVGSFLNTSLSCDDIEKTYHELADKGVMCVCEPQKEHWGSYFLIKDSEDNTLCITG